LQCFDAYHWAGGLEIFFVYLYDHRHNMGCFQYYVVEPAHTVTALLDVDIISPAPASIKPKTFWVPAIS
jgi:hypothetical protein